MLKNIAEYIHQTPVYADRAYIDEALSHLLAQQESPLNTPVKKKKDRKNYCCLSQLYLLWSVRFDSPLNPYSTGFRKKQVFRLLQKFALSEA